MKNDWNQVPDLVCRLRLRVRAARCEREAASGEFGKMLIARSLLDSLGLPIVEEGADVLVVVVEVGEFAGEVDGALEFA